MATLRLGMRMGLVTPVMEAARAKTERFQKASEQAFEEAKLAQASKPESAQPVGQALAEKHGCLACHGIDQKIVGPAYKDVAQKNYSAAEIVQLVHQPKPEHWPGYMPMPAMPQVPASDIEQIANWINSLK